MPIQIDNLHPYLRDRRHSVAIGVFDGVHLGHQKVLKEAGWALTFHPHPREVLTGGADVTFLTTLEERQKLIPRLLVLRFNRRLANYSPERFVKEVLVDTLKVKKVFVGYDFCFGKNRSGNIQTLIVLGRKFGFEIDVIPVIKAGGVEVRSSKIRQLLTKGRVDQAAVLLGRPYRLEGQVVGGQKLGRKLGFPTANLKLHPQKCLPALGIYQAWACLGRRRYKAVVSIGLRPTVQPKSGGVVVEAYLLRFQRSIYGQNLALEFLKHLRPERRFGSLKQLVRQMQRDVKKAWGSS